MELTRRDTMAGVAASATAAATSALAAKSKTSVLDGRDSTDLAALVKSKQISATELLDAAIARAESLNPRFNFMAQRHYDYARKAIANGLPEGPFTGVPWLLKDLSTYIAGELTEGGSRFYKGYRAAETSELVKRIERAGFVVFGKTTAPEFGLTPTTENKLTGDTHNPWNAKRIAGGSSGGAAAAVSAGVIPAAHATDGGGSIRIPASCCGLFGLKPSRGRVPMGPQHTEGWGGMSAHHAVSWTVRDSAAILDATHGIEPGSRYGAPSPDGAFLSQMTKDPGKLRIAVMTTSPYGGPVDPEVVAATRNAAKLCENLGHHVEEAAPQYEAAQFGAAAFVIMAAAIAAEIDDRAKATNVKPDREVLEDVTLAVAEYGRKVSGEDSARANNALQKLAVIVSRFMTDYDLILAPTLAAPPLELGKIGLSTGADFQTWSQRTGAFVPFTALANYTGQPSMSVPLGMSKNGLPIGVMFTGRYGDEATLFRLASQLEQAAPWRGRRPKI